MNAVSAKNYVKGMLAIADECIWSFRNVLLLAWNTEDCFDRTKLSFVPNALYEGCYFMKIWDDSIRSALIWDDAKVTIEENDNTIGYYENRPLNLKMKNGTQLEPFKRCLSYQHYCCFIKSKLQGEAPGDFGSDPGGQNVHRNDIMILRKSLQKDIKAEAESEAESEITKDD
jgi:hypothetical protein